MCDCRRELAKIESAIKTIGQSIKQLQDVTEDLAESVEDIEKTVGIDEFPASLPETFWGDQGGSVKLSNIPQLQSYTLRQIDALIGEFPVNIQQVVDGKKTDVQLGTVADGMAELFGLMSTAAYDSDLAINLLYRMTSELIATKNATLITQDWAKANASFLGYNGNSIEREIPSAFSPAKAEKGHKEFLRESTYKIEGWKNDETETLKQNIQRLMFAAQLIKSRYLLKDASGLLNLFSDAAGEGSESWEELMQKLNDPKSQSKATD